ncbi:MAG TPA: PaaI family thioesterase [Terriglobales bacterium]|nr:PaaI family thioesterase [Terriglobales bacterium]
MIDRRWDPLLARSSQIAIFKAMEISISALGEGRATLTMPYERRYDGIFQSFHGGLLMTLADTAACIAVLTLAGPDAVITTTDMNIRFLAACTSGATAEARVIKFGRSLCPTEVMLRDTSGHEVAIAQVTYMRLEKMPSRA